MEAVKTFEAAVIEKKTRESCEANFWKAASQKLHSLGSSLKNYSRDVVEPRIKSCDELLKKSSDELEILRDIIARIAKLFRKVSPKEDEWMLKSSFEIRDRRSELSELKANLEKTAENIESVAYWSSVRATDRMNSQAEVSLKMLLDKNTNLQEWVDFGIELKTPSGKIVSSWQSLTEGYPAIRASFEKAVGAKKTIASPVIEKLTKGML
ncbi:hypothetical protein H0N98_05385 [Candidatus Micrarchaeota archaeon]|nr:hypothetical protein [Candidatus Micrarchaeota archaeon]